MYKSNGVQAFLLHTALFVLCSNYGPGNYYQLSIIYDEMGSVVARARAHAPRPTRCPARAFVPVPLRGTPCPPPLLPLPPPPSPLELPPRAAEAPLPSASAPVCACVAWHGLRGKARTLPHACCRSDPRSPASCPPHTPSCNRPDIAGTS